MPLPRGSAPRVADFGLRRDEQEGFWVGLQERREDLARLGSERDHALATDVLRLVVGRAVLPVLAAVDVREAHLHDFADAHPGEPHRLDHGADLRGHAPNDLVDVLALNRADGWRLAGR